MAQLALGLGSNLGGREEILKAALASLENLGHRLLSCSTFFENPAMGQATKPFLNAAALFETEASPEDFFKQCQKLENEHGREQQRKTFWGDRHLDLDILFYDDVIQTKGTVLLPHLSMHRRDFVLKPLAEICPEWVHPIFRVSVSGLKAKLES